MEGWYRKSARIFTDRSSAGSRRIVASADPNAFFGGIKLKLPSGNVAARWLESSNDITAITLPDTGRSTRVYGVTCCVDRYCAAVSTATPVTFKLVATAAGRSLSIPFNWSMWPAKSLLPFDPSKRQTQRRASAYSKGIMCVGGKAPYLGGRRIPVVCSLL